MTEKVSVLCFPQQTDCLDPGVLRSVFIIGGARCCVCVSVNGIKWHRLRLFPMIRSPSRLTRPQEGWMGELGVGGMPELNSSSPLSNSQTAAVPVTTPSHPHPSLSFFPPCPFGLSWQPGVPHTDAYIHRLAPSEGSTQAATLSPSVAPLCLTFPIRSSLVIFVPSLTSRLLRLFTSLPSSGSLLSEVHICALF